jgi:hypothetical protein
MCPLTLSLDWARLMVRVPRLACDTAYLAQPLPLLGDRQFIRSTLNAADVRARMPLAVDTPRTLP